MADDPLADAQPPALADPLAGWTPGATVQTDSTRPPPQKSILQTDYDRLPSETNVGRVRSAFGEGFASTGAPSVTRQDTRSVFTPETQQRMNEHWWGPAANIAGEAVGTGVADVVGAGNSAWTLANETLRSIGTPPALQRDINAFVTEYPFEPSVRPTPRLIPSEIKAATTELARPPTPSLPEVWRQQRAQLPPDPATQEAITILRRAASPTDMPTPPTPFTPSTQPLPGPREVPPTPPPAPSGGLLSIPPGPSAAPVLAADEILARSHGYYSPADKQAAQGAMINSGASNDIRGVLTDAVPSDPQHAAAVGNTPLIQLGKDYQPFQDQPMSYDTVMALDRRLTTERQAALRSGNNTLASQIEDAQGRIRDKMQGLGPGDTTGDPTALANLQPARQAYSQYIKQSQIEDLKYRASLLPEDKQDAYLRTQGTSMLRGNATRTWTDDERGAFEQAIKSGQIGSLTGLGISMIKPAAQTVGGLFGGAMAGPGGAYVGAQASGELGQTAAARLRAYLSKLQLDPVSQAISRGVPPPPGQ